MNASVLPQTATLIARTGSRSAQLRQMLLSPQLEFLMEAHNGLSARIVREAGFKGIWASGLSISAQFGVRDNNEASWTQVVDMLEFMADASDLPILLDGDMWPVWELIHLPRLWLKHLLHGAGLLQEEYRHGASGVDLRIAEAVEFDPDAFRTFVESERPDYLTAEAWVREHARNLTPEVIEELRLYTTVAKMPANLEAQRRERLGHIDPAFGLGYELNQLDDWYSIHEQLIAHG